MNHNHTNPHNVSGVIAFDLFLTIMSTYALFEIISQSYLITNYDLDQNMTDQSKLTFLIAIVLLFSTYKITLLEVLVFEMEELEELGSLNISEEDIDVTYIMGFDDMV